VTDDGSAARPFVSVVVPAYNEELVLHQSLTTICDYMRGIEDRYRWEVVVVNDGSTDQTGAIAEAFAATHPEARVLHHKVNFNLGQALQYAFGSCTGDYVVVIDCDLTYSVDHIGRLLEAIETQHARIVIASPYTKGGHTTGVPRFRGFMSRSANRILGWAAKGDLTTLTGMVRAYDRRFLSSLDLKAVGPEINTEILYKAQLLRARIVEIPAHLDWSGQKERIEKRSAPSLRIKNTTALQLFSSFLFRPLAFFVIPGLVLLLLALWSLGSVAITWFHQISDLDGSWDYRLTQGLALAYQDRPQTFIVGGVSLILAVQLISLGILAMQAKRYFEELFHLGTSILRSGNGPPDRST
jgi:glycosyltransferase involved in cell wall biosynthesis